MADNSRNLIILSDGTGNSAAKAFKTNVWRLYQAIDLTDGSQVAVFGDGVGTSSVSFLRIMGLALGVGVKRNVLNLYKFLCRNYKDGDRIWAFGFSRGAFTIRVVAGLICREGLVTFNTEEELNRNALAAYRAYRKLAFPTRIPWVSGGRYLRDRLMAVWNWATEATSYASVAKRTAIPIHFLGVWDTVAAYGLPIDELTLAVDAWVWPMRFRDESLLACVRYARHALSLDDERRTFFPVPWDETAEKEPHDGPADTNRERLQQVWFPGAHADVGGGYPDDGLSYVALCWMIEEAAELGLVFAPSVVDVYKAVAAPTGRIYDSRSGFGAFWRYQPRDVGALMNPPRGKRRQQPPRRRTTPLVHSSVITRMVHGNDGYAPISLPKRIDVLLPDGPPIAFDDAAVTRALEDVTHRSENPLPPDDKRALEKRRQFLMDMKKLVSAANGQKRAERFALVQDTVWWRRIVYFISLFLFLMTAAYPLLQQYLRIQGVTDGLNDRAGGPTGWAIGLIEGLLPGLAKPWLDAVVRNPAGATLIITGLLASLAFSAFLQRRISDRARAAWNVRSQANGPELDRLPLPGQRHALVTGAIVFGALAAGVWLLEGGKSSPLFDFLALLFGACVVSRCVKRGPASTFDPARPGFLLGLARKARQSDIAVACYRFVARTVAPAAFLFLCAIFVTSLAHRAMFDLLSTGGRYCHSTLKTEGEKLGTGEIFHTSSMCHATGLRLVAGREYRIRLEMSGDWFDKGVRTDVGGFAGDSLLRYVASPLKRWWRENWFQPIARIGELGNYEHALRPDAPLPVADFSHCRSAESERLSAGAAMRATSNLASPEVIQTRPECEASTVLISDLRADATGELFIYVNDAVLTWPGLTGAFYKNNSGAATVTVTRVLATATIEAHESNSE
jgi:uncharacterized protein (DUF2235 family)